MTEDEVLQTFLDNAVKKAREEIENKGVLTAENAIPFLLRSHYNHILHLDSELAALRKLMDERFKQVNEQFKGVSEQFKEVSEQFKEVNERFDRMNERMNRRFEKTDAKISRVYTFLGIGFSGIAMLIVILQFFG